MEPFVYLAEYLYNNGVDVKVIGIADSLDKAMRLTGFYDENDWEVVMETDVHTYWQLELPSKHNRSGPLSWQFRRHYVIHQFPMNTVL